MDAIEPYLQVFRARKSELGLWLRRPSGYTLLIATNVDDENSAAYMAGVRNNDVVFRIDTRPSWEMAIGDALMLILFDAGEDNGDDVVTIEWLAAAHASLALRVVHSIRTRGVTTTAPRSTHGAPATPTGSRPPHVVAQPSISAEREADRERQRQNIERRREQALHHNQSPEQNARHRARNVNAQMSDQRVERRRVRNLHRNMDERQVQLHRERTEQLPNRHTVPMSAIQLSYAAPCQHCNFRYLDGERRALCCGEGKATRPPFPPLIPLSPNIRRLATNYPRHFTEQSFQYNNVLAFAIIGVDNGNPDESGFMRPGGPSCIKIHGRTYHRLANADGHRNAVRYMCTFLLPSCFPHRSFSWVNQVFCARCTG